MADEKKEDKNNERKKKKFPKTVDNLRDINKIENVYYAPKSVYYTFYERILHKSGLSYLWVCCIIVKDAG